MNKIPTAVFATDFVAMRSICIAGQGRVSELILSGGKRVNDPRTNRALVDALARYYAIDLVALRQRCSKLLHGRNFMPLPLHPNLTLVPLALGKCGEKTGYINLLAVKDVRPQGKYSLVELDNCSLDCELSVAGVRNRLLRAQFVLRELERRGLIAPIGDKDWQHKLELIKAVLSK